MNLEVMCIGLEVIDGLLPIRSEDLSRCTCQTLIDLPDRQYAHDNGHGYGWFVHFARGHYTALYEAHILVQKAVNATISF